MRILFLTNCLEGGRDGVGDYSTLLAQECVRQGHQCYLIALNDRFILKPSSTIDGEYDKMRQLRLPSTLSWSERIVQTNLASTAFNPDWVSLQFVPYGFHPKGLVFGLARQLQLLTKDRRLEIMFHELWIGEPANSPLKQRMIGVVQRRLMLDLVRQLQPQIIHTSNSVYVNILERDGVKAHPLPLFGNVPVVPDNHDWLFAALGQDGLQINAYNRDQFWLGGFFGSLPPDWSPERLFSKLRQVAKEQKRRVLILSVGNLAADNPVWQGLSARYSPEFLFFRFGNQPTEQVSQYLSFLDFGIATTSYARIGKSGSAAAMLDHGLPVIVSGNDEQFRSASASPQNEEPLLYRVEQVGEIYGAGLKRHNPCSRLPRIATTFTRDLQCANFDVAADEQTAALAYRS